MQVLSNQTAVTPADAKGPGAAPAHETLVFDISGMKCAGCVRAVEKQLVATAGVVSATVNLVTEVAVVEADTRQVSAAALAQRVTAAGFAAQVRSGEQAGGAGLADWVARKQQEQSSYLRRLAIATLLLALSTLGHLKHVGWLSVPVLSDLGFHFFLATVTLVGPARDIVIDGWQGLRRLAPNMNTLVTLGALSAYSASVVAFLRPGLGWECFFDEPVMLLSFILLGRTLEQRARYAAANALRSLVALQPATARLICDPQAAGLAQTGVAVPAAYVQSGEWLQVLPGEQIPADGTVVAGTSTVDQALLTGEAAPVFKQPGDAVVAGSLNQSGAIALQVTGTGQHTLLAQMIRLVETAQSRKAPIQRLADAISGYFTYGVLSLTVLTFLFWYFVGLPLWPEGVSQALGHRHAAHQMTAQSSALLVSLKLAISVLVVACPCALGLATPTAILVGSGLGAQRGLLIRGGDILETVHHLDTVVFDKTGTLTLGQPSLTDTVPLDPAIGPEQLLQLAATVESGTRHPLAIAVQQAAQQQDLPLLPADQFETVPGLGVGAEVSWQGEQKRCLLGNQAWMEAQQVPLTAAAQSQLEALAAAGKTAVYLAWDQALVGILAAADQLRPDALEAVQQLQARSLSVQILTGDKQAAGQAIAAQLAIAPEQVIAEVTPQGKVAALMALQAAGHCVALVGDGINDAPALVQADVGISLTSGTDIALEAADIVLMRDQLAGVIEAIDLSRATFNKIRQNLIWAFAYNLVSLPLAAGLLLPSLGLSLTPAIAGGLMAFSSVTVVVNSLLLRRQRLG